jgi:hypothetical protein
VEAREAREEAEEVARWTEQAVQQAKWRTKLEREVRLKSQTASSRSLVVDSDEDSGGDGGGDGGNGGDSGGGGGCGGGGESKTAVAVSAPAPTPAAVASFGVLLGERSEAEKGEELARREREREEAERGAAARRRRERSRHTYCMEYYYYEEGGGSSRGASGVRKVVVTVEGVVRIKKDRAQGYYDGIDAYSREWYKGAGEVAVLRQQLQELPAVPDAAKEWRLWKAKKAVQKAGRFVMLSAGTIHYHSYPTHPLAS